MCPRAGDREVAHQPLELADIFRTLDVSSRVEVARTVERAAHTI
jgi:hypothetical protein